MDLILDSVGGDYFSINMDLLRPDGRLVYINAMDGMSVPLHIMKLMKKRIHITGSTLRARSKEFKKDLANDILHNAFHLLEVKRFQNMVRHRFSLEEDAAVHE